MIAAPRAGEKSFIRFFNKCFIKSFINSFKDPPGKPLRNASPLTHGPKCWLAPRTWARRFFGAFGLSCCRVRKKGHCECLSPTHRIGSFAIACSFRVLKVFCCHLFFVPSGPNRRKQCQKAIRLGQRPVRTPSSDGSRCK